MEEQVFELQIAGRTVRFALHHPMTAKCFPDPLRPCSEKEYDIKLTDREVECSRKIYPLAKTEEWREYKMLVWPTSDYLLDTGACIVHSVSMNWLGRAWLLCAPSGTGKSTQFRRWRQIGGMDVRLINGDMSAVSLEPSGELLVWPTPWHGKEGWIGDPDPVPLGGIVFLEQATVNELHRINPGDAVQRILHGICSHPKTEQTVHIYASLADEMLKYPLWVLRNRGDEDSALVIMEAIRRERGVIE